MKISVELEYSVNGQQVRKRGEVEVDEPVFLVGCEVDSEGRRCTEISQRAESLFRAIQKSNTTPSVA